MSVAFLLDAPTITLETDGDDGALVTQHPIARLGKYKDRRYGEFAITRADYTSWVRNLRELQNGRIPIDYDHAPEAGGSSEAAGWITSLELRTGAQLIALGITGVDEAAEYALATIEWTPDGAAAVKAKRWLFVSPTFSDSASNEEGEATGPYLHGVALTNRPFLRRGMPAISLCADDLPGAERSDTPAVPEIKTLRAALKLADTVSDDDVIAAAVKLAEAPPEPTPKPEDARTLAERAQAEGLVVLTAADHSKLAADAEEGAKAAKTLHDQTFTAKVKECRTKGSLDAVPETEAMWRESYDENPDRTLKLMDALPVVVKLKQLGAETGETPETPENTDPERHELNVRVKALQAADPNLSYEDALYRAEREAVA